MGKTFNLAETFGDALRAVPNSGTGREQIEYIDEALISGDARNFYELSGLEELAANIELIGLQQPIRVRPDPDDVGGYLIVSGHRRMAAIRQHLKPEAPDKWAQIPCIVERDDVSPAMQELRLIYANSATREMSNADKAKQVERVTELLYKLKGEGVSFPGRMRDHVAEACQISKSKLSRLKVINDRLIDDLRPLWDAGKLSEDTAYTIAQADEEYQRALLHYYGKNKISGSAKWWVESKLRRISKMTGRKCTVAKGPCAYAPVMLQWLADNPNSISICEYYDCCADCQNLATCSRACPEMADKRAQLKAQRKADKAAEAKAVEERDRPYVELTRTMLQRWDAARQAAGKSVKACYEAGDMFYGKSDETNVANILAGKKKIDRNTRVPYHYCGSGEFKALIQVAKLLGCSTDYLLGLSDELQPGKAVVEPRLVAVGWTESPAVPDHDCTCAVVIELGGPKQGKFAEDKVLLSWRDGAWRWRSGHEIDMPVLRWVELPEDAATKEGE